ncbi:hypothetical protein AVEN_219508-1 [Araneus ventricosus]|uniref:Uncharacterized protein n=1 Tax=Araneus ventricosus TaxID=182803 RepID=A0A4Y2BPP0_ARAVE|nr:hypothetical protein AVEN_219508-1 [Araneus ventricosus]
MIRHQRLVNRWTTKRFDKPRAVGTARLVGIPPNTVHKYEPRATRGLPSHTPWEQGFIFAWCGVNPSVANALPLLRKFGRGGGVDSFVAFVV